MAKRMIDLSFTLMEGMTTFPVHWHPVVEITQLGRFGIEDRETRKITLGTHTGTHLDAPRHFIPGGETVDNIPVDVFVGPALVLDFTDAQPLQVIDIEDFERQIGADKPERIIMRFDWDQYWGRMKYYTDHPYISDAAAQWLVDRGVRLLGMDTPQADSPNNGRNSGNDSPVHKILLGHGVIKLEYLCNLRQLTKREIELIALPLKIKEGDGAPVRCIAIEYD